MSLEALEAPGKANVWPAEAGTPNLEVAAHGAPGPTARSRMGLQRRSDWRIVGSSLAFSFMIEWNIQSRAHACQGCGRSFNNGEPLHTLLYTERGGYARLDVCEACWTSQHSEAASNRKGFISHWQGSYTVPPATTPDAIQKDTAESLLRKLLVLNDPAHAGACFILAVMLERKRILKVKAQSTLDGHRVFVYEQPKTGDLFTIPDPNLQMDQLEAVQHDVAHLLEHGLTPPPAPPSAELAVPADSPAPEDAVGGEPGETLPPQTEADDVGEAAAEPQPPPQQRALA